MTEGSTARGPHGTVAVSEVSPPVDLAKRADRLMGVFVSERVLASCLTRPRAPWVVNLPTDFQIVGSRVDAARKGVVLIVRSEKFPRVARDTPIPELKLEFNGLLYCR